MSLLSARTKAAYAAPGFAFALIGIPVYVHLPKFYGDTLGVSLTFLGAVILLSRLWDAVTDPALGYLSDRTRSRWGRRRPYLVFAAPPLALSTGLLLAPPPSLEGEMLGWWFAAWLFVMFLAWTAVQIPHAALGAELTFDHHERTAVFAARDGLWILGTLVAAAGPAIARTLLRAAELPADDRAVFRVLALAAAPMLVALPWWCAAAVREPIHGFTPPVMPWTSSREAWDNRPFRLLLLAYGVGALGAALPATLILFYVEHVLRAREFAELFLGLYFLTGFLFLPAWTWIARRVGKKRAWLGAMAINAGAFVFAFLLGPGDTQAYGVVCIASGIGFGAGLVLPNSLVADVVDYDELRTGTRREGLYFGLWSIVTKGSAAVGAGMALPALEWAGYAPQGEQPPSALFALRFLYSAVPCVCYGAGLAIAARFPIDERLHHEIREGIARRAQGGAVNDPLTTEGLA